MKIRPTSTHGAIIPGSYYITSLACQGTISRKVVKRGESATEAGIRGGSGKSNSFMTDEELAKAKDGYLNSYVFNFQSKSQIVNRMMTYAYFGYPLDFTEQQKAGVEKVTKADILRVAKKYLKPDKVQILVIGKKADFDKPLSTLGNVNVIDIAIPPAKQK